MIRPNDAAHDSLCFIYGNGKKTRELHTAEGLTGVPRCRTRRVMRVNRHDRAFEKGSRAHKIRTGTPVCCKQEDTTKFSYHTRALSGFFTFLTQTLDNAPARQQTSTKRRLNSSTGVCVNTFPCTPTSVVTSVIRPSKYRGTPDNAPETAQILDL